MTQTTPEKFSLKDHLFNRTKVGRIAREIHDVYPAFKEKEFVKQVVSKFPELELKARITWIAACLKDYLPQDYTKAVAVLLKALPLPNDPELTDDDFGEFIYAPYAEYVARYGCTKEDLEYSLNALYEITQRFSVEDAIRYFINAFPKETLKALTVWSKDSHYHVRRLCSEGTRPKLPWSQKIAIPVTAPIPILDNLFLDRTRFVTRSVANHVNDISKVNPDVAIDTLVRWKKTGKQEQKEMDYIVRHALRTLVKEGNPKALTMLGFLPPTSVRVSSVQVPKRVRINTALEFSFVVQSQEDSHVLIDYILYFQNKAGKLNSKKVYKLTKLTLTKDTSVVVSKRHHLKAGMTTRTLYPGVHEIEIQVNGIRLTKESFLLE